MTSRLNRTRAAIGGLFVVVLTATAALAWWTTAGAGTGEAETDTPQEVTAIGGVVTSPLFPTGEAMGDLSLTVTNPNAYELRIYEFDLDTTQDVGGYSQSAVDCDVTFADQTTTTPWVVPASGVLDIDLIDSVTMATTADDDCQGESFTIYVKTGQ